MILIVNDEPRLRTELQTVFEGTGCRTESVSTGVEAVDRARQKPVPDMVLLGMDIAGADGLDVLRRIRRTRSRLKVIMLASSTDPQKVWRAAKLGAHDCVEADDAAALKALAHECMQPETADEKAIEKEELGGGLVFVAASPVMRKLHSLVAEVAPTDVPVLCIGESGTGKEVVARLLHNRSRRRSHNFLKVNCAALPGELLESELFGYEPGAFTGAVRAKPGKFELCDKGTIFLDEIGEVPPQLQAKLLHVLQDREFTRLGGRSRIKVDVRIVAATNINIQEALRTKKFREDLYYRLNTVVFEIPPLRQRREDVLTLLTHFVETHGGQNGLPVRLISESAFDFAGDHDWPGNVRELENFAKRYLVLGDRAMTEMGPEQAVAAVAHAAAGLNGAGATKSLKPFANGVKSSAEAAAIRQALEQTHWNRKAAARLLDISYKTLLDKVRRYQLEDNSDSPS
ncbi:MAG: sigma-54 dependent transcriptional regulator [Bryobacteraceae bacterium]